LGKSVLLDLVIVMLTLPRAVATVSLILAAATAHAQPRAAGVVVDPVTEQQVAETAPILGRLVAATRSVVATRTQGIVDEVFVEAGDRLDAGDVIARLDVERLDLDRSIAVAAVEQARADFHAAEADVALARQALERISKLQGSGAFSQGALDDRQSEFARARSRQGAYAARVASAEAQLSVVDYELANAEIRAPFDGVVIDRAAQPGAYLALGAAVATLLDVGDLEIEADVPTEYIDGLEPGMRLTAMIGRGILLDATMRAVIPEEAVTTRTRPVRFTVDLEPYLDSLASGQSVTLRLPTAEARSALTISKDAVTQSPRGWLVYVAADGVAQPRVVEIGASAGDRLEVLSGVGPGDYVVVRGNERLRPGQPIDARLANGEKLGEG
jgi:RND family efflux transporter MFP subunit